MEDQANEGVGNPKEDVMHDHAMEHDTSVLKEEREGMEEENISSSPASVGHPVVQSEQDEDGREETLAMELGDSPSRVQPCNEKNPMTEGCSQDEHTDTGKRKDTDTEKTKCGEEKDNTDKKDEGQGGMTFRGRVIRTACAQAAYLAVGFWNKEVYREKRKYTSWTHPIVMQCLTLTLNLGMIGPSMLDLEMLTQSTTQEMSTVFTWRALLGLIASLVLGPLLDHLNKFFVVGVALVADVIFIAAAPWSTHIAALLATMAPPEFFNSAIGMGTHLICISLWGADSGPALQALNLMATIGYALSPLLCKPFLAPSPPVLTNNSSGSDLWNVSVGNINGVMGNNASFSAKPVYNFIPDNNSSQTGMGLVGIPETKIQYAYLIVAIYDLIIGCAIFAIFIKDGARIHLTASEKDAGEELVGKKRSKEFVLTICILFFLFNVFYGGIEVGYAGLLMTFAVKYLGWSKADGTNVTALLQISNAVVTAAAILISRWVRAQTMLLGSIGIVTAAMLVLSLTVQNTSVTLWLCTACLGVGYATIMPCSYTWVNDIMMVTGKFSSAYWAGFFTGFMLVPAITGQLFYHVHPMWLPYATLICSIGMFVFFVIISVVIWHDNRKEKEIMKEKPCDK